MPMYAGINGAVHKLTSLYTGISGAVTPMEEMWAGQNGANTKIFSSGTAIGDLPVGTVVPVQETAGTANYLIVQQGLPSSIYDSSCNGTWLWRVGITGLTTYGFNGYVNNFNASILKSSTNSWYYNISDPIKSSIKLVKIPYSSYNNVTTGASGAEVYAFPLAAIELGFTLVGNMTAKEDGSRLQYFATHTENSFRIQHYNSSPYIYWTRSMVSYYDGSSYAAAYVSTNGSAGWNNVGPPNNFGIAPTIIVDPSYEV